RLAAGPGARRVVRGHGSRADFSLAIDDRGPLHLSGEQAARLTFDAGGGAQPLLQIVGRWQVAAACARSARLRRAIEIGGCTLLRLRGTARTRAAASGERERDG